MLRLFRNSTFYCFCFNITLNALRKIKKKMNFVIFGLNGEVNKCFWKTIFMSSFTYSRRFHYFFQIKPDVEQHMENVNMEMWNQTKCRQNVSLWSRLFHMLFTILRCCPGQQINPTTWRSNKVPTGKGGQCTEKKQK